MRNGLGEATPTYSQAVKSIHESMFLKNLAPVKFANFSLGMPCFIKLGTTGHEENSELSSLSSLTHNFLFLVDALKVSASQFSQSWCGSHFATFGPVFTFLFTLLKVKDHLHAYTSTFYLYMGYLIG